MKNDALAIVPLNIDKLESICINRDRRLTADDKKRLLEILIKNIQEKRCLLDAARQEAEQAITQAAKDKAGLDGYRKELDAVDEQINTLRERKDKITLRCENATGFSVDGSLLSNPGSRYGGRDDESKIWALRRKAGIAKADQIRNLITLKGQEVDRFGLKFEKVETRLVLATTNGEAMDIMESVLGNGDAILKAVPVQAEVVED